MISGDETARALYLLLLGLLVASGVLATYRGRMGAALRHAFLWALIFAGIALLYLMFASEPVFTPTPGADNRRAYTCCPPLISISTPVT